MATGRLGAVDVSANVNTTLYTAPADTLTTTNINLCNRSNSTVNVRVAVLSGAIGTLSNADYIEYGYAIAPNGVMERTGIVVSNGQSIIVHCDAIDVSVVCWGFEESTLV